MTKEQYKKLIGTHKIEITIGLNAGCSRVIEIEIDDNIIFKNMDYNEAKDIIYDIAYEQALEYFEISLDIFKE